MVAVGNKKADPFPNWFSLGMGGGDKSSSDQESLASHHVFHLRVNYFADCDFK